MYNSPKAKPTVVEGNKTGILFLQSLTLAVSQSKLAAPSFSIKDWETERAALYVKDDHMTKQVSL